MAFKRPPPLRPLLQLAVIATRPRKAPAQETANAPAGRFDGRVGRAHETLSQVLEAVRRMRRAIEAEVEVFELVAGAHGGGGVVCSAEGVLFLFFF